MEHGCSLQTVLMAPGSGGSENTELNTACGCGGTSPALGNLGLTLPAACYLTY